MPPQSHEANPAQTTGIELWGGHECTVNRVRDQWFDQTPRSGHERRCEDLELFADLGIRSLRYGILWERVAPKHPDQRDFAWSDERMATLQRLGINPIVTLCHHGSGPHYTSLVDDGFASGLADYARAVATRYPWISDWTPVNEPLTTARFSALYGYWYPHSTDEAVFWTALLNEIDATRLAMREIRRVNPAARLIQTDDLGFCHATAPLQREADFQNDRRWIGWDLLCGMVVPGHPLWSRIADFGLAGRLQTIAADPCPPDVIGINHYLSSERLLDHRVEERSDRSFADRDVFVFEGGEYVDIDAIRHVPDLVKGLPTLLEEAWLRYGRVIAVTECHLGATREEQARWFVEVWEGAQRLRERGVHICAVTAWSLLGAYDWNRMVTRSVGHYEPGVFDMRSGSPRPTLIASVLKALAKGEQPDVPGLSVPGWWRRERSENGDAFLLGDGPQALGSPAPLIIVGDDEALAELAINACETRGLHYRRLRCATEQSLRLAKPWAVLDVCPDLAAPSSIASMCAKQGSRYAALVLGPRTPPAFPPEALVATAAGIYAPSEVNAPAVGWLEALDAGETIVADLAWAWDRSYGPDLINGVIDLLLDGVSGAVSFAPVEDWSAFDFAQALAEAAGRDVTQIGCALEEVSDFAPRATAVSYMPPAETTLERFVRETRADRAAREDAGSEENVAMLAAAECPSASLANSADLSFLEPQSAWTTTRTWSEADLTGHFR